MDLPTTFTCQFGQTPIRNSTEYSVGPRHYLGVKAGDVRTNTCENARGCNPASTSPHSQSLGTFAEGSLGQHRPKHGAIGAVRRLSFLDLELCGTKALSS